MENHQDMVGFVPQDDIVHPDLTVYENLMYSGLFRLPKGTSEIDDADDGADCKQNDLDKESSRGTQGIGHAYIYIYIYLHIHDHDNHMNNNNTIHTTKQ